MNKKILCGLLLAAICSVAFFSCKKSNTSTTDPTLNYFPIKFGHYVTYNVDSVYFYGSSCTKYEIKSQIKYAVTDTFRNSSDQLSYILNVYSRPYDGGLWVANNVIELTLAQTTITNLSEPTTTSLYYTQDQTQYVKLMFPISNGYTWQGNQYAQIQNAPFAYLANWNYVYQNMGLSYFNGQINFDKTVTVQEDNEWVNYPGVDTGIAGYRTYATEVYAYNIGMIYKEWTHYTWAANADSCRNGYTVTMTAVDYNQ